MASGADFGRGRAGANTYQASAPEPPACTRKPAWPELLPGPDRGCGGWLTAAAADAVSASPAARAASARTRLRRQGIGEPLHASAYWRLKVPPKGVAPSAAAARSAGGRRWRRRLAPA